MQGTLKNIQVRVGAQLQLIPHVDKTYNALKAAGVKHGDLLEITIHGEKRSLTKNALSHVWYQELDKTAFDTYAAGYARRYCKAHFGIPLMAEDEDFRDRYNSLIRKRFTYEEKLELMDWLPVTSLMNEDQMGRYLHTMQQVFAEGGYILTTPKDSEYEKWQQNAA